MSQTASRLVAVLGADSPIGLTVIRELGGHGVPVLALGKNSDSISRYSRHARDFAVIEAPLAEWLPALVREKNLAAILAISEHHLIELAELKGTLGDCLVLAPDSDKLAIVLDKRRTLEIAARLGLAVPETWQPLPHEDFARRAAVLAYPVAVKWPDPNTVAGSLDALGIALEKVEYAAHAPALLGILARYNRMGAWPLVQTWCPGEGLGQMLHMANGKATLKFQHRRLREWPPTGGASSFCEAVPLARHAGQMERSEALLRTIGWEGPAMVEYRFDQKTGTYWLMEINGRFWGSLPLAWHCGAHFAWETYRRRALCQNDPAPLPRSNRKARYVFPDVKHLVAIIRDESLAIAGRIKFAVRFLLDFLDPRVRYYVWSSSDPLPLLGDVKGALGRRLKTGRRAP